MAERAAGQPDRVGRGPQVAADQGQVAGLDGDVGAGAHGQPEVGLGERGGVVDAVADHGDDPALGLQPLDDVDLVGGQHLGDHASSMPTSAATARAAALVVAGQQDRASGRGRAAGATASAEVGLTASATTQRRRGPAPSQPTATAVAPVACGLGERARRARRAGAATCSASRRGAADERPACPSTTPCDAEPLEVGEVLDRRQRADPVARAVGDRPGRSGARRRPRARRRAAAPRRRPRRRPATTSTQGHPAGGDGAGLVEHDGVDPAGGLEHLGALDQDAELGAAAGADHAARSAWPGRGRTGRR